MRLRANEAEREYRRLLLDDEATAETIAAANDKWSSLQARADGLEAVEAADNGPSEDAEARELRELEGRVEVRRYIGAAMDGGAVDGAEAEYNAALDMERSGFPLRLLAPETRATTDTDSGVKQGLWLDRLFSQTATMHVGVSFRSV